MKRISHTVLFLILIFLPNVLFAADWADTFPIYIYGDVSFLATIYEFIKSVVTDDSVEVIVTLGFTITAFIAGFKLKDGDIQSFSKSMIAPITLLALFFTPSVDVKIVDIRVDKGYIDHTLSPDGGYQEVDGVPYAIAFLPASAMLLVNLTIDIIDNNWDSVHIANQFSSIGFQEMTRAINTALAIGSLVDSSDPKSAQYDYDLNVYIKECIIKKAIEYKQNSADVYEPKHTFPEMFNPAKFTVNFGDATIDYIDFNNSYVTNQTCNDAYATLVAAHSSEVIEIMKTKIDNMNPTKDFTSEGASEAFRQQIGDTGKVVGNIQTAVATTVTGKFLQRQQGIDAVGIDGYSVATQLSIDTTLANMRSEGPAKLAWVAEVLPTAVSIISGILIASFPFLIIVQSFMGATAFSAIANYFMGFFAFYFNLVALALVQNIIAFYTAQKAQETIVNAQNMPFSVEHISDFMIQQANMTGIAGIIGVASIFALTPLIFYGEMKGFSAAIGSVSGMFGGNIGSTSRDTLTQGALEAEIDRQLLEESGGMNEGQASRWLTENGYSDYKRSGVSALDTYSQIMKGYNSIGSGLTAQDLMYSGNVPAYSQGAYLQSTQQMMKQVGTGRAIDSVSDAGHVAMQDGEVMSEGINASHELRKNGYNTQNIGGGMSMQQYAKDIGTDYIGSEGLESVNKLVANAVNQSAQQLASGDGILKSGAFNNNGTFANNENSKDLLSGYAAQALGGTMQTIGFGDKIDMNAMKSKSFQDGQVQGQTVNDVAGMRNTLGYDVDNIAKGTAASSYAKDMGMDEIAKKMNQGQPPKKAVEDSIQPKTQDDEKPTHDLSDFIKSDRVGKKGLSVTNSPALQAAFNDGSLTADNVNDLLGKYGKDLSGRDFKELKAFQSALSNIKPDEEGVKTVAEALAGAAPDALSSLIAGSRDQSLKQIAGGEALIRGGGFNDKGDFVNDNLYSGYVGNALKGVGNTIGFGSKANFNAIKEVSTEDGEISGKNISEVNGLRNSRSIRDRTGKSVGWNIEDVARGQALDSVGKEFGTIGKDNAVKDNEEKKFMQGNFTSGRVDANKSMGIGRQYSEGAMSLVQESSHMNLIGDVASTDGKLQSLHDGNKGVATQNQIASLQKGIREGTSKNIQADSAKITELSKSLQPKEEDPNEPKHAMGFYEMTKTNAAAQMAAGLGQAQANDQLLSNGTGLISQNAEYGTLSQALTTNAKMNAQGGMLSSIATDVADAQLKAVSQQGAVQGQIQELAQKAGMSLKDAKPFSEDIISGAKQASDLIAKGITNAARDVAFAMSAGKTGSDIVSIDRADEKYKDGGFVGLQKDNSQITTDQKIGTTGGLLQLTDAQKEGTINNIRAKAYDDSDARGQAVDKDLLKAGLIDEKGNAIADNWVSGKSFLQSNNMNSHNALVAGGAVFSGAMGADGISSIKMDAVNKVETGNAKTINRDAITLNIGDQDIRARMMQNGGDEAEAIASTLVSRVVNHMSSKEGMIGNATQGVTDAAELFDQKHGTNLAESLKNPETAEETISDIVQYGGIATAGYLVNKYGKDNNPTKAKKFDETKGNYDFDEESKTWTDTDTGSKFKVNENGNMTDLKGNEMQTKNPNYGKGGIRRGAEAFGKNLNNAGLFVKDFFSSETLDESINTESDKQYSNSDDTVKQTAKKTSDQSTPPNNDSASVTNSEQNVKKTGNLPDSKYKDYNSKEEMRSKIREKESKLEADYDSGKLTEDQWVEKQNALDDLEEKLDNGKIKKSDLHNNGIKADGVTKFKDGYVDFKGTDAKVQELYEKINPKTTITDLGGSTPKESFGFGEGGITQQIDSQTNFDRKSKAIENDRLHSISEFQKTLKNKEAVGINMDYDAEYKKGMDSINQEFRAKQDVLNQSYFKSTTGTGLYSSQSLDALNSEMLNKHPIGHVDYGKPAVAEVHTPSAREGSGFGFKGAGLFGGLAVMGDQIARGNFGGAMRELYNETVGQSISDYNRVGGGFSGVATAFTNQVEDMLMGQQARVRLRDSNLGGMHAISYAAAATLEQMGSGASYVASIGAGAVGFLSGNGYANSADRTMAYLNNRGWDATGAMEKDYSRQGLNVNWGGGSSMASINPHSGAITPNYMHQGANNPFATNTSQIISNSNEDMRSSLMDLNYSNEETAEKFDKLMEYIRNKEGR